MLIFDYLLSFCSYLLLSRFLEWIKS